MFTSRLLAKLVRLVLMLVVAATLVPAFPSRAQTPAPKVLFEKAYTLSIVHTSPTSGITSPTGDQIPVTVRVSGPETISLGQQVTLVVEFFAANYASSMKEDSWEIARAQIALVLPDAASELTGVPEQMVLINNAGQQTWQEALAPNEAESRWLPASMYAFWLALKTGMSLLPVVGGMITAADTVISARDFMVALEAGQPLTDDELWSYYQFEMAYDTFQVPDYAGAGGARGERTVKRYEIPLQFSAYGDLFLYVNALQVRNAYPNAMGPGDFTVHAEFDQQVIITLPLASLYGADAVVASDLSAETESVIVPEQFTVRATEEVVLIVAGSNPNWANTSDQLILTRGRKSQDGRFFEDNEVVIAQLGRNWQVTAFESIWNVPYHKRSGYDSDMQRMIGTFSPDDRYVAVAYNALHWRGTPSDSYMDIGIMVSPSDSLNLQPASQRSLRSFWQYDHLNHVLWLSDDELVYSAGGKILKTDRIGFIGETQLAEGIFPAVVNGRICFLGADGLFYSIKPNGTDLKPLPIQLPAQQRITGFTASANGELLLLAYNNKIAIYRADGSLAEVLEVPVRLVQNISLKPDLTAIAFDDGDNIYVQPISLSAAQ